MFIGLHVFKSQRSAAIYCCILTQEYEGQGRIQDVAVTVQKFVYSEMKKSIFKACDDVHGTSLG